ncbi:MAG: TIR domain-containing protein, partial [Chloroflexi bacterium]|nr:TIR domain-containing protein [Chloroflexota bacterium]
MSDVFISYSRVDSTFMFQLNQQLNLSGIPTWVDLERLTAGMDWKEEIDAAIRAAPALVV